MTENEQFLTWFEREGGVYAKDLIGLQDFPDSGRGAVALRDIEVGRPIIRRGTLS